MSLALNAFTEMVTNTTQSELWRDGELIVTPWAFRDGEPVVVYVRDAGAGHFLISDRGQASDNLLLAGVDLARKDVYRSWEAVQHSVTNGSTLQQQPGKWELQTSSNLDELGLAIHHVAEAALRADGLRALTGASRATKRFDDWVIRKASERGLAVVPRAEIKSTVGVTRRVSALIRGSSRDAYVQALGKTKDTWDAHDRARSVFMDSSIKADDRFTVIADDSMLSHDQVRGIEQHSNVVMQVDFPDWLTSLAA